MNIGWPEGIYLTLVVMTGIGYAIKDGQVRRYALGDWALSVIIVLPLLWWGGFFD